MRFILILLLTVFGQVGDVRCRSLFCPLDTLNSAVSSTNDMLGRQYVEEAITRAAGNDLNGGLEQINYALHHLTDSIQIVRASCIKGLILANLGRYKESEAVLKMLLPFCERAKPFTEPTDLNWIIDGVYSGLTRSCIFTGNYRTAIRSAYESLELGFLFRNKIELHSKYIDLGIIYYKLRDNMKAVEMYKKALQIAREKGKDLSNIYSNLALCYSEMDHTDVALSYADSARLLCGDSCPPIRLKFNSFNYGMIYLRKKLYDQARLHFENSLLHAVELGDYRMMAENFAYLAKIYLTEKDYESAEFVLKRAEKIALAQNLNEILLDVYRQSVKLFSETLDHTRLSEYQRLFVFQKKTLHNSEVANDLALAEWHLAEVAHKKELALQQRILTSQVASLRYQKWLSIAWSSIIALMLLLVLLLVYRVHAGIRIRMALTTKVDERSDSLLRNQQFLRNRCASLTRRNERIETEIRLLLSYSQSRYDKRL